MGRDKIWDFEADLEDPMLKQDIEFSKEKLDFLEGNKDKCFLCKWILEDYKKNGTLRGVKEEGALGSYELFPLRGEINHLWLELYRKPYPFKKKVTPQEERIHGLKPPYPPTYPASLIPPGFTPPESAPANAAPAVAKPVAKPAPPQEAPPPPPVTKNIDGIPVSKPKR